MLQRTIVKSAFFLLVSFFIVSQIEIMIGSDWSPYSLAQHFVHYTFDIAFWVLTLSFIKAVEDTSVFSLQILRKLLRLFITTFTMIITHAFIQALFMGGTNPTIYHDLPFFSSQNLIYGAACLAAAAIWWMSALSEEQREKVYGFWRK